MCNLAQSERRHSLGFVVARLVTGFAVLLAILYASDLPAQDAAGFAETEDVAEPPKYTLAQCIQIGLSKQAAIQVQMAAAGAAQQQEAIARSYFYPQVDLQTRYTNASSIYTVAIPVPPPLVGYDVDLLGQNFLTTQVTLVQPLWTGGKIRYRHQQAELGVQAAQCDVERARQETTFNITRAYLTIVLTEEMLVAADDTAGSFRVIEDLTSKCDRYVTKADLCRISSLRCLAEGEYAGLKPRSRPHLHWIVPCDGDRPTELDRDCRQATEVQQQGYAS